MKQSIVAVFAAVGLLFSGCATLIHGSHQTIPITSNPPGAKVNVGGSQYITPAQVSLARDQEYQAIVSKPGYQTQTAEIHSSFSSVTFVDLIFIIPWAVDLADGAAYSLEPESMQFQLQPQEAAAASPSVVASASGQVPSPPTDMDASRATADAKSPADQWQRAQ